MNKEMKNKKITINDLAIMVAKGFENTATKDDLKELKLDAKKDIFKIQTSINSIETNLKSFKKDTGEILDTIEDKLEDLSDTVMSYDKRIETLEIKED